MINFINDSSETYQSIPSLTDSRDSKAQIVPRFARSNKSKFILDIKEKDQQFQIDGRMVVLDRMLGCDGNVIAKNPCFNRSMTSGLRVSGINDKSAGLSTTTCIERKNTSTPSSLQLDIKKPKSYYPTLIIGDDDPVDIQEVNINSVTTIKIKENHNEADSVDRKLSLSKPSIRKSAGWISQLSNTADLRLTVKVSWGTKSIVNTPPEIRIPQEDAGDGRLYRIDTIVDCEEILAKSSVLGRYMAQKQEAEAERQNNISKPNWLQLRMLNFGCSKEYMPSLQ